MAIEFHVTSLGLSLGDGRVAMPGTVIKLKANPPSHWQRFGEVRNAADAPARKLEVATPASEPASEDELEELRMEYEILTGNAPDGRWKEGRLKEKIAKAKSE